MSKGNKAKKMDHLRQMQGQPPQVARTVAAQLPPVSAPGTLLGLMQEGSEYASLIGQDAHVDLVAEIRMAAAEIELVRGRPLLIYCGNVVRPGGGADVGINRSDDLPFSEMVGKVPANHTAVDLLVVTPGGEGQQVAKFVSTLRSRFTHVGFIVPFISMSAGTIWAMASDQIVMAPQGVLGPIDPQVTGKDGRLVPAQALLTAIGEIQKRGDQAMKSGTQPNWTDMVILKGIDPKEIGNAMAQSSYSIQLTREYLKKYKFATWTTHSSDGRPVTDADKDQRANEIASKLCSHDHWKTHSHGISREVLSADLRLKIDHTESIAGLDRAVRRLWALLYWALENSPARKIFASQNYMLVRNEPVK